MSGRIVLITVPVWLDGVDAVTDEVLRKYIDQAVNDIHDGRRLFSAEMLVIGAEEAIAFAAARAIEAVFYARYGNEMVDHGNGSQSSRASIEAEPFVRNVRAHQSGEISVAFESDVES